MKKLLSVILMLSMAALSAGASVYDVNGDGVVDINDVNRVVNTILGRASWRAADVNGDGRVSVADLNAVVNAMLGRNIIRSFTVNGVTFRMVYVEGGTFTMGTTDEPSSDVGFNAKPLHQVTLSDYFIGETEVTQALWVAVLGSNPSPSTSDLQRPVELVSWAQCYDFISKLNELTGVTFRLPTEAEWEFAARGGNRSRGYMYAGSNNVDDVAWYDDNTISTHPVATLQPNELGLYDMSGNVWEWCQDYLGSYRSDAQTDPVGPASGLYRVRRGGGWYNGAVCCRVAYRSGINPFDLILSQGLRLALVP